MEWKWAKTNEKDLARFVNEKAIQLLDKLPINDRLQLIQDESGRRSLVKAIYETLVTKGIRYDFEKYQPEDETQLIRTPVEILSTPGEGTCLDLALLFCSLCFGYGLLPLLIVIEGHAFAAVSLKHKLEEWNAFGPERSMFDTSELFRGEENLAALKKLIEDEAYIAVECTGFAHSQVLGNSQAPESKSRTPDGVLSFGRAVNAGKEQLENPSRKFKYAIDIAAAKYIWKIPTEEIPNFDLEKEKATAEFNVNVKSADASDVTGVEANKVTTKRNLTVNVTLDEANNKSTVTGGKFGEL
jgi:hypothetical protein